MPSRRDFLQALAAAPFALAGCATPQRGGIPPGPRPPAPPAGGTRVNDVHSGLNDTWVERVLAPRTRDEVAAIVREAETAGRSIAIAGGRHAMGGQQFLEGGWLVDTLGMSRIRDFDGERGLVTADAGIVWPDLVAFLETTWEADGSGWGIVQKQTGADRLTLGGALAANVHGRVLTQPPISADVERFILVDPAGKVRTVTRLTDVNLFRLVIGGYGLFGVVTEVTLRLAPRTKVRRRVTEARIDEVAPEIARRIAGGHRYGDFQFAIDPESPEFLRRGILSTYVPVGIETPIPPGQRRLTPRDWEALLVLAHTDPSAALDRYLEHYLATDGQVYWSDTQQLGYYREGYHAELDAALGAAAPATETIGELYVPPDRLADFMADAARRLRGIGSRVVYGTVRFIEPDTETFLPWARRRYACIVFNLHTEHTPEGLRRSEAAFRSLIDAALALGGSFYLTYHRWATRSQVELAYPRFAEFLRLKRVYDPAGRLRSDWYEHVRGLFAT